MKKLFLPVVSVLLISCFQREKLEPYSVTVSVPYYRYDLQTGIFEIVSINLSDTVKLSSSEKIKLAELFFRYRADTLRGEKTVLPKNISIMPDAREKIEIFKNGERVSRLEVSSHLPVEEKLNGVERDIYEFHRNVRQILYGNTGFKKCLNVLEENGKRLPSLL